MHGIKGHYTFEFRRIERVKWPSPITTSEGVIKFKIAGRFLI